MVRMVDSMMRLEFKIPVFDELDLVLKKDEAGCPMLNEFRASNQNNRIDSSTTTTSTTFK